MALPGSDKRRTVSSPPSSVATGIEDSDATGKCGAASGAAESGNNARRRRTKGARTSSGSPLMNRIWLQSYPAGMPAEIDPDRFASIPDMLDWTVAQFGDRPAFHNRGRSLRYRE